MKFDLKLYLIVFTLLGLLLNCNTAEISKDWIDTSDRDQDLSEVSVESEERITKKRYPAVEYEDKKSALKDKLIRLSEALKKLQDDTDFKESPHSKSEPINDDLSEKDSKVAYEAHRERKTVAVPHNRKSREYYCDNLRKYLQQRKIDHGSFRIEKRNATVGHHNCSTQRNGERLEELLGHMYEAEVRVNSEVTEVDKYKEMAKESQGVLAEKVKILKDLSSQIKDAQQLAKDAAGAAQEAQEQVLLHDKKLCKARHDVDHILKEILEIEGDICSYGGSCEGG